MKLFYSYVNISILKLKLKPLVIQEHFLVNFIQRSVLGTVDGAKLTFKHV